MKFIDLAAQQKRIRANIETRIHAVLDHGQYVMGPEITELEKVLAGFAGTKYALSCASGTDALLLALMAYEVGPGDAIFTTPFTFMATAEVIALLRATPIFVDIDPVTFNMDPKLLEQAIQALEANDPSLHPLPRSGTPGRLRPRGVIAVDLFGLPADYDRINSAAEGRKLFVIEDAAQSFGARLKDRKACNLADIGCTSFFPSKPLGAYGDGGMCFTDREDLHETMLSLRIHGQGAHKYENVRIGLNGRLDSMQAAVLLAKFEIFEEEIALRQAAAERYTRLLGDGASEVVTPKVPDGCVSAWAQYSVLARNQAHRYALQERLNAASTPTAVYYPKPLHLQPAFGYLGYAEGDFPVSEDCAQRIFSLPMHPYLTEADQKDAAKALSS